MSSTADPSAGVGRGGGSAAGARPIALDHSGALVANLHGAEAGAFTVAAATGCGEGGRRPRERSPHERLITPRDNGPRPLWTGLGAQGEVAGYRAAAARRVGGEAVLHSR